MVATIQIDLPETALVPIAGSVRKVDVAGSISIRQLKTLTFSVLATALSPVFHSAIATTHKSFVGLLDFFANDALIDKIEGEWRGSIIDVVNHRHRRPSETFEVS
jgi:hypothetical protein